MDLRSWRPKKIMVDAEKYAYRSLVLWAFFMALFLGSFWFVPVQIPLNTPHSAIVDINSVPHPSGSKKNGETKTKFEKQEEKLVKIRGTSLRGKAVESFRARLDCFSESGKWVYNSTPRLLPWNAAGDPYTSQCDGRHSSVPGNAVGGWADILASQGGNWTVREELKWVWKTRDKCPLVPLERDDLCRLIGAKGNVLIVGDSINHLVQWSIINNLLKNHSDPEVKPADSNCRTCPGFEVCSDVLRPGKGFRIGFVRNDRISAVNNGSEDFVTNFLEWPWVHLLREWNTGLLILNRGAHFEADDIFTESLRRIFSLLHDLHPDLFVVFRNTPPGHVNCTSYSRPISERQKIMAAEDRFHWSEFERQNGLAKKIVEEFEYVYMDVDAMLSKRPDGHINERDCLHYCIPGPLDSAVELFYNILKLVKTTG